MSFCGLVLSGLALLPRQLGDVAVRKQAFQEYPPQATSALEV